MDIHFFNLLFVSCQLIAKTLQYENLASKKTVTVSKRYNNAYFAPNKAVDGDRSTNLLDCSLTASGQKEAWLTVDLGENKNIASISILHGGLGLNASPISQSDSGIFPDSDGDGTVFTSSPFNKLCEDNFDTQDAQVICLAWGFLPDNPSHYVPSDIISTDFLEYKLNCNGNEVNIKDCPKGSRGCQSGDAVAVTCKKGSTLSGFSVYVSDTTDWKSGTHCYQHDIQQIPPNNITVDCVASGRYVTVYNARTTPFPEVSEFSYINICEIDVKGCDLGFYGENCTKCPQNCLNDTCHFQAGECFACKDGYNGAYCEKECSAGQYGQGCSLHCGNCLGDKPCNNVNVVCPDECSPGWRGDKCDQECLAGQYGQGCSFKCGNCLGDEPCNKINGVCTDDCSPGWRGDKCDEECDAGFYGQQCNLSCSVYCKGKICDPATGQCIAYIDERFGPFCETDNSAAETNSWKTSLLIAVPLLSVAVILLVTVMLVSFLRRKCRSSHPNNIDPNYETAVTTKDNSEYIHMHHSMPSEFTGIETPQYMEITKTDVSARTEYINLDFN